MKNFSTQTLKPDRSSYPVRVLPFRIISALEIPFSIMEECGKLIALLASLVFTTLSFTLQAQDWREAEEAFGVQNYFEAIDRYSQLIEKEPLNMDYHYNLGLSYLRSNAQPESALDYFMAVESAGKYDKQLLLDIAKAYTYHLQYEESLRYLERFEAEGGVNRKNADLIALLKSNCTAGMDLIKYPVAVTFKNPGETINSKFPDYHPFIAKNGSQLFYTSRRKVRPGSHPEFDGYFPSDIYTTNKEDGAWKKSERLNDRINSIYDEQTAGITASGDTLFFYIDHVEDYGDIFRTVWKGRSYMQPERVTEPINGSSIESACALSRDGKTMVYSSNRSGGMGGLEPLEQPDRGWCDLERTEKSRR